LTLKAQCFYGVTQTIILGYRVRAATVARLILFFFLVVVFLYLVYLMVAAFNNAVGAVDATAARVCNEANPLCDAYSVAKKAALSVFAFIATALLLAFMVSLVVLYMESVLHEH